MRKSVFCCIAVSVLATASCVKDPRPDLQSVSGKEITLSLGFEEQTSVMNQNAVQTKTYLNSKREMLWGTSEGDKVIYVFDTKGNKNVFDGSEGADVNQPTRAFKGTISPDSEVDYVIWTGQTQTTDKCVLNNGVFSGTTLKVLDNQKIDQANSFAQTANVAVMKPGDKVLRNVFGYIQYTLPAGIESVTFSATENLAGLVEIDYSGENPTAKLLDNGASKSILVKTKYKNNIYEAGTYYAVLPAGTYTNFTITVKPVEGEAFILTSDNDVVIVRGKFTSAGTLPATAPEQTEPDPGPGDSTWPSDETAFDYNLTTARTADFAFADNGYSDGASISDATTINGVTFSNCKVKLYPVRVFFERSKVFDSFGAPTEKYISFKITRPGTLEFYCRLNGATNATPRICVAVLTTKSGTTTYQSVYSQVPSGLTNSNTPDNNTITVSIDESHLAGIDKAATVYIYSADEGTTMHYFPFTWTPAN